ncbi:MAG: ribonuclease HI family protein [Anaerolineae bacterium]|nr:ribonuclease HI family protein [Ardenticatenia bacterium]HQZ72097.1 ribonuclease HI family protein [Anaerolineae bacterium]
MTGGSIAAAAPTAAGGLQLAIVFDGGSLGNPGKGYGSYRLRPPGADWGPAVRLEYGDGVTNNEAEYRSLLAALEDVAQRSKDPGALRVLVYGDSQLVLRQLEGAWKVKAENLRPLWEATRAVAARFKAVRYQWQPRARSVDLLGH